MRINELIVNINKLSFTNDNILKIFEDVKVSNNNKSLCISKDKDKNITKEEKNPFFYPENNYNDSLFWCWIIYKYGINEYQINSNYIFQYEKQQKINLYQNIFQNNKKIIKQIFKITLNDIQLNCLYEQSFTIGIFIVLMFLNNVNVIYYDDKLYYEKLDDSNKELIVITRKDNRYGIYIKHNQEFKIDLHNIKNNRIVVDNINKPLNAISNYKVAELKDICKKLNINIIKSNGKSYNKKELYLFIKEKLN